MCVSCGCKKYEDDHGDKKNLTTDSFQDAADAAGISVEEVGKNIAEYQGSQGMNKQAAGAATGANNAPTAANSGNGNQGQGQGQNTPPQQAGKTGQGVGAEETQPVGAGGRDQAEGKN